MNSTSKLRCAESIKKYIAADDQTRKEIENEYRQSMSNAWLMLEYMSESAKLAVINKDKSYIEQGLYANVIEGCKQDYRDNLIRLTKLYHSSIILELNPDKIFKSVANQTRGEGKELILKFIKRAPCNKTLKCMGLKTTRGEQFDFFSDGKKYQLKYKIILYDHFGLDIPDVESGYYYIEGFLAWFVLQHHRSYKPFITKMESSERTIIGQIQQSQL
jgi:hypothetical protein